MDKAGVIYKITNLINGKIYIGQTTQKLYKRWGDHCSKGATCKAISSAIQKYGKSSFQVEEICSVLNKQDLNSIETYFIKHYKSFGLKGYNLSLGGEGDGSEVLKKQVVGYNTKTKESITLNCINRSKDIGFDPRSIQRALKNEYSIYKGYFWFYLNEFNDITLMEKIEICSLKRKRKNSTSQYKGVSWNKKENKWYACIAIEGKTRNLGYYTSEIDAKDAYMNKYMEVYHR